MIKKKSIIIATEGIRTYYLTFAKKYWWSNWKLVRIGDNEYPEGDVGRILIEK